MNNKEQMAEGILYVVATPIGNLEDITLRAIKILKEVDFILCEDKRVTVKLLNKYEIKKKLFSFHKFNEVKMIGYVLSLLQAGKNIALVSDSGTPLISDPGSALILATKKNNIRVASIPGPSALTCALSVVPFDLKEFLFIGFLPSVRSKRSKIMASLRERAKVVVIFVAPHDLNKYLKEIYGFYPDVEIFYGRELTKVYEEYWCGRIKDLLFKVENCRLRGEIVLILNFGKHHQLDKRNLITDSELINKIRGYIDCGHSLKEASKFFAKELNVSSKELYELYLRRGRF